MKLQCSWRSALAGEESPALSPEVGGGRLGEGATHPGSEDASVI